MAIYGDQWENQKATDEPAIGYPTDFEPPDLDALVKSVQGLLGLDLGPTATKELKKGVAREALPDLAPQKQQDVDKEIDGQEILTAQEKQQQLLDAAAQRLAKPPMPKAPM